MLQGVEDSTTAPADPFAVMRTRKYLGLLILAAVLGVVISALVYWLLKLIADIQTWVFTDLPKGLGFHGEPAWWPLLPLTVAGAIVGATVKYLPGRGGHSPADGFKPGGVARANELPGILLASVAGLGLGVVIGPEAPVIALGGGLAVLAVKLARRDMEPRIGAVIAATGSFAAISTLLGNPLAGAFLLLEASGLGGPMATIILIPGLVGAGAGSLIFLGLNSLTGYGTFSLAVPDLPAAPHLDVAQFGWAVAIGLAAGAVSFGIRWLALFLRPHVERRLLLLTPVAGLAIAGLAIAFAEGTGKPSSAVLFSGQTALSPLLEHAADYTAGTLVLLVVCKGLAYSISLCGFRGGPTFPGMFVGAAAGIALSHLPGLPMIAGAAMGIGAMTAGMLQLPLTAVLITTLFLGTAGLAVMPLVIVAVVVSFVLSKYLAGPPTTPQAPETAQPPLPPQVR
ncbi:chloride channel protein [Streptomyces griseus]|uniref:chloride channel protein n=1 Tax=Streptomyces griseus TaxID=1911 RepID=UPI00068A60A4|nr:chloride channel protein [Streptomyces griseus]